MRVDLSSISAIASVRDLQRHYLPDGPATPYLPGFHCDPLLDMLRRPRREIFSTAAPPRVTGLSGDPADELKICLETQADQVNHTSCWDSSYLQISPGIEGG
ncbi:hypothetical protein [Burkholderia sp. MSMB1072]|uniref:hypothetical protein n=1 Tax=Burkholderia sp. MSMB1072 TaxID=1637871 RepID=UPI0012E3D1C9|nr:hypothetical protein [Burkholderia sp. MSMB1072]